MVNFASRYCFSFVKSYRRIKSFYSTISLIYPLNTKWQILIGSKMVENQQYRSFTTTFWNHWPKFAINNFSSLNTQTVVFKLYFDKIGIYSVTSHTAWTYEAWRLKQDEGKGAKWFSTARNIENKPFLTILYVFLLLAGCCSSKVKISIYEITSFACPVTYGYNLLPGYVLIRWTYC